MNKYSTTKREFQALNMCYHPFRNKSDAKIYIYNLCKFEANPGINSPNHKTLYNQVEQNLSLS